MRMKSGTPKPTADRVVRDIRRKTRKHHSSEEMGWMPLSPEGIAMCQACGVETQAEGDGIHGRS
jgi:hypothetical protein